MKAVIVTLKPFIHSPSLSLSLLQSQVDTVHFFSPPLFPFPRLSLRNRHTCGSLHPMHRWHSPWIVCITPPPPPPLPPPPSPAFKSAASTHTLRRWLSTWPAPLQPEYLHSLLWAAECVLLGLRSDGWVDFRVLWIILAVTEWFKWLWSHSV